MSQSNKKPENLMAPHLSLSKFGKIIDLDLEVLCHDENGIYVAYMPALDLTTHGDDVEDATNAALEASKLFLEGLAEMGTLDQVLSELGWKKKQSVSNNEFPFVPPHIISKQVSIHGSFSAHSL